MCLFKPASSLKLGQVKNTQYNLKHIFKNGQDSNEFIM